jgi:hypothetical protein
VQDVGKPDLAGVLIASGASRLLTDLSVTNAAFQQRGLKPAKNARRNRLRIE